MADGTEALPEKTCSRFGLLAPSNSLSLYSSGALGAGVWHEQPNIQS